MPIFLSVELEVKSGGISNSYQFFFSDYQFQRENIWIRSDLPTYYGSQASQHSPSMPTQKIQSGEQQWSRYTSGKKWLILGSAPWQATPGGKVRNVFCAGDRAGTKYYLPSPWNWGEKKMGYKLRLWWVTVWFWGSPRQGSCGKAKT